MSDFLFECLSEEMPVHAQSYVVGRARSKVEAFLKKHGFQWRELRVYVTPRRWAVIIRDINDDPLGLGIKEVLGPRVDASDRAISGFLNKHVKDRTDLKIKTIDRKNVFYLQIAKNKADTTALLAEMMSDLMSSMCWAQSMRWSNSRVRWVRPITNLLCIYDGGVVPFEFAGFEANDTTLGHRYMHGNIFFEVWGIDDYFTKLESSRVFLDHEQRKLYIKTKIKAIVDARGLKVELNDRVLDRVVGSVEWPVILEGAIDERFMSLPPQVLIDVMMVQQDYFPVCTKDGELAPFFISISNVENALVVKGNERVLSARLEDACFMIKRDLVHNLSHYYALLDKVVFHSKLGSIGMKIRRIQKLSVHVTQFIPGVDRNKLQRFMKIAKADLVTAMVGDFPSLQGIIGRYYAMCNGEDEEIAEAIAEHYYPLTNDVTCTTNLLAVTFLISDRFDTLVGLLGAGEKVSSSRDPMGIKKTMSGIIMTVIANKLRFNVMKLVECVVDVYVQDGKIGVLDSDESRLRVRSQLQSMFFDRLQAIMLGKGIAKSCMDAMQYRNDLYAYFYDVRLLVDFISTQLGQSLLHVYRRVVNMLSKEERKEKECFNGSCDSGLFLVKPEIDLAFRLDSAERDISSFLEEGKVPEALSTVVSLHVFVKNFIEEVVVNCDSHQVRRNRLNLLSRVRTLCESIADLKKIID